MDTKHSAPATKRTAQRGFTLIESAIAMVVTAIVAAAAAPGLRDVLDARRLDGTAASLAADLRFVRTEAMARQRPLRLSVRANAQASCWIVHTGAASECTCGAGGAAVCIGTASAIKSVLLSSAERLSITGNVGSIVFDPLHGTSTPAGTLRLVTANGRAIHHIVNVVGRVRTCSPGASVPSHPAC